MVMDVTKVIERCSHGWCGRGWSGGHDWCGGNCWSGCHGWCGVVVMFAVVMFDIAVLQAQGCTTIALAKLHC